MNEKVLDETQMHSLEIYVHMWTKNTLKNIESKYFFSLIIFNFRSNCINFLSIWKVVFFRYYLFVHLKMFARIVALVNVYHTPNQNWFKSRFCLIYCFLCSTNKIEKKNSILYQFHWTVLWYMFCFELN